MKSKTSHRAPKLVPPYDPSVVDLQFGGASSEPNPRADANTDSGASGYGCKLMSNSQNACIKNKLDDDSWVVRSCR